jgi:hypothetical protein
LFGSQFLKSIMRSVPSRHIVVFCSSNKVSQNVHFPPSTARRVRDSGNTLSEFFPILLPVLPSLWRHANHIQSQSITVLSALFLERFRIGRRPSGIVQFSADGAKQTALGSVMECFASNDLIEICPGLLQRSS